MTRTFCLDANLSYKVAKALTDVEHPFVHVTNIPALGRAHVKGQQRAEDEEIAKWCAVTETTLVTIDTDFRGRWLRSGALERCGVEVIVFKRDLIGLDEQHRVVTASIPGWHDTLGSRPYTHRVWEQNPNRKTPDLLTGPKPRKRRKSTKAATVARNV